jgi:streptogramin lyase
VPISIFTTFSGMGSVAVDAAGDIYLADTGNHAIRRIARSGAVTTVAGTGAAGFVNGNGRAASFNRPTAVAVDRNGNLYVADSGNNAIRKISPAGDVSTFAGRAAAGFSDGPGPAAAFYGPDDVAVGADGTVYVSDTGNRAIRKITPAGVVSTLLKFDAGYLAAVGALGAVGPLAVDSSGTVLVKSLHDVFAVSANGTVTRRTNITDPWSLSSNPAVDTEDNLYYVVRNTRDKGVSVLVRLSPAGVESYVEMQTVPHPLDSFANQIAVDGNGNIVVTDPINSAIRIVLP